VREFAFVLRPAIDEAFMAAAGERERAAVDEHWQFLLDLHRQGRLVYAGRCFDGPFAIVVFEAEDQAEAEAIVARDPTVRDDVQSADLYPFKTGLLQGRE